MLGFFGHLTPAIAHDVYQRTDVGQNGSFCLIGTGEISEWNSAWQGQGVAKAETRTADPSWAPCWQRPYTYVDHALTGLVYFYDMSAGNWQPCFGSDWSIRTGAASSVRRWQYLTSPYYGCGETWYLFYAGVGARAGSGSDWIANWVLAGNCCENGSYYHYLYV
jgi:hypothetical protein